MHIIRQNLANHIHSPGGGFWGWLAVRLMGVRNRQINEWTVARLDIQPTDHILEIGFGAGKSIQRAAQQATAGRVAGIDPSPAMVRETSRRNRAAIRAGRVEVRQGDVMALPFDAATFDKAFGVGVIYYLSEPVAALREIGRVLKPGGLLLLLVREPAALAQNPVFQESGYRTYERDAAAALFTEAGFTAVGTETCTYDETAFGVFGRIDPNRSL
ncbi:MAG: class I SAM-dependent methyltransferase [Anaerolineae bacterium]|nr:class I SAM-dependent methyltransferase [Anaerolineae bacterium]